VNASIRARRRTSIISGKVDTTSMFVIGMGKTAREVRHSDVNLRSWFSDAIHLSNSLKGIPQMFQDMKSLYELKVVIGERIGKVV
jgi:hypothetical protein